MRIRILSLLLAFAAFSGVRPTSAQQPVAPLVGPMTILTRTSDDAVVTHVQAGQMFTGQSKQYVTVEQKRKYNDYASYVRIYNRDGALLYSRPYANRITVDMQTVDFQSDGLDDIVTSSFVCLELECYFDGKLEILKNLGNFTFSSTVVNFGSVVDGLTLVKMKNGHYVIAVIVREPNDIGCSNCISLYDEMGNRLNDYPTPYLTDYREISFALSSGDINGDGDGDLFMDFGDEHIWTAETGLFSIWFGNGQGDFNLFTVNWDLIPEAIYLTNVVNAKVADSDGDGIAEIFILVRYFTYPDNRILKFKWNAATNQLELDQLVTGNLGLALQSLDLVDLDGNGELDVASVAWYNRLIVCNQKQGRFIPCQMYELTGINAEIGAAHGYRTDHQVLWIDRDGDGRKDLVADYINELAIWPTGLAVGLQNPRVAIPFGLHLPILYSDKSTVPLLP